VKRDLAKRTCRFAAFALFTGILAGFERSRTESFACVGRRCPHVAKEARMNVGLRDKALGCEREKTQ
jgi:hypothetical protein